AKFLSSKKGQDIMATSIYEGILGYKAEIDENIKKLSESLETTKNENNMTKNNEERYFEGVIFKVQLAASSRKLAARPYNFKGLEHITRAEEKGIYKYYYGATSDYNSAQRFKDEAAQKGYKDAFIVAFKNGKKVPLKEVLH
ncbi:MAG: N-acetylmuramoyl-L-alanine amidase, partial [Flavobacteriaceae bacterium]|nr:N-acetylmuramoyl-L-alanine amidase [Flavobacteriaceae bacterium]